jgi:hypothetical protein
MRPEKPANLLGVTGLSLFAYPVRRANITCHYSIRTLPWANRSIRYWSARNPLEAEAA